MRDYVVRNENVRANIRFSDIFERIEKAREELQAEINTDMALHYHLDKKEYYKDRDALYEHAVETYQDKWLESFKKKVGDFK